MTQYYVERVILDEYTGRGMFDAVSYNGDTRFRNCVFLHSTPDLVGYEQLGRHALLMTIDNQNFILGYYMHDTEVHDEKIFLDGEKMIRYGKTKAVIMGDEGYIGIYDIQRKPDGRIKKTPRFEYNADNEAYLVFSKYLSSMEDASTKVSVSKDMLGFNVYEIFGKGHGEDAGYRMKLVVKGGLAGMDTSFIMDLSPLPRGGAVPVAMGALPSLQVKMNSFLPLEILYSLASIPNASIKIDKLGAVTIKAGIAGFGASIALNPAGVNAVVLKNDGPLSGKVTIKNTGKVDITSPTGVEITGKNFGLLQTLIQFMTMYDAHTHGSAMGPTTQPIIPSAAIQSNLSLIKGT
ncbi:MAG: hypothetical protein Q8M92_06935 [Candidatus Subteraquimicrobiales bacterium]|nr:hypothetical protein [Candidatus Subteraquimicrobiales bacterium]